MTKLCCVHLQLDEACCRKGKQACIGGPLALLSVWSWLRFPVGRPKTKECKDYGDNGNPILQPTWAYIYDESIVPTGDPILAYRRYTGEFDNLTPEQVKKTIPFRECMLSI